MKLENFAFLIAGPREFLINLVINSVIPWYLTKSIEYVSIWGNPSLASLFLPMSFILVAVVSMTGFTNGMTNGQLNKENLIHYFQKETTWLKPALLTAGLYGLIALTTTSLIIWGLQLYQPNIQFSAQNVIVAQGLIAAFLAYAVQVNAILQSKNLKYYTERKKAVTN
jgi:hypothetical protein